MKGRAILKKEITVSAKTVESAVEKGAQSLGVQVKDVRYEVIAEAKKGFLGIGETLAKVNVIYECEPIDIACEFVNTVIKNMALDAEACVMVFEDGEEFINIEGKDAGVLIGHHGDTLDQLQYLANLVANKKREGDEEHKYQRIMIDAEGYREKREDTLRALARRMANKVIRYRRNVSLEPMNAYERRIIHSEIQNIDKVTTYSVGEENERRVIIALEKK